MADKVSKKLDAYIRRVDTEEGSDLHLTTGRKPMIRVADNLIPLANEAKLTAEDTRSFIEVLLNDKEKEAFLDTKDIDFSYSHDGLRFRANCFFQRGEIGIAMRLIPSEIHTLDELNLPERLSRFAKKEQGFFLVVGPVGMGKTTTLASLLDIINRTRSEHIITIENPIEYVHEQKKSIVDQRSVGEDTASFSSGLNNVFRQDVDVVMVGEMRDRETISTAVTAAETGHLVYSTLHTNNASQTIDRIIDIFPPEQQGQIRTQLANSLTGIFSQRLVKRTSGGRTPAYELLINNDAVSNLIREGRVHEIDSVIDTHRKEGMISMERSLIRLIHEGEIRMEDARRYSLRPEALESMI
jgi:twitching motility protein PilT